MFSTYKLPKPELPLQKQDFSLYNIWIILIAILVGIATYFYPQVIPLIITVLIIRIYREKKEKDLRLRWYEYCIAKTRNFIQKIHKFNIWDASRDHDLDEKVKSEIEKELHNEYIVKNEWNEKAFRCLNDQKYSTKKSKNEIYYLSLDLDWFEYDIKRAKKWLSKYDNEQNEIIKKCLKKISFYKKKKTHYNLEDLVNIKDIYDSITYLSAFFDEYVWTWAVIHLYRSKSNDILEEIGKFAKKDDIILPDHPILDCLLFRTAN